MRLKFWYIYIEAWNEYIPDATSYYALQKCVSANPDGTSKFEEEKILGCFLSNGRYLDFLYPVLKDLTNLNIQYKDGGSEAWWANIRGDTVEMSFIMDSDDPDDENYKPPLILPRKEVAYAVEKWIEFLKKEINPKYSEIIDTEDVYKEVE